MEQNKVLFSSDKEIRDGIDVRIAAHAFNEAAAVFMARYVNKTEKNLTADCGDGVVLQIKNDISPEEFETYVAEELAKNPDAKIAENAGKRIFHIARGENITLPL